MTSIMRMPCVVVVAAFLVTTAVSARQPGPPALLGVTESTLNGVAEVKGQVLVRVNSAAVAKRFVLRHPADRAAWNGSPVIGAHGGSGGNNFDPMGKVIGTGSGKRQ